METSKKYDKFSRFYDQFGSSVKKSKFGNWRSILFEMIPAGSTLLEAGIGTGKNIPYYSEDTDVTGIDFSKGMLNKASEKIKVHPEKKVQLLQMSKI